MIIGRTDTGGYILAAIRVYKSPPRIPKAERNQSHILFGFGEVLTVICPFCGSTHVHGLGDSRKFGAGDGERTADCGRGGYIIREIENPNPPGKVRDPRDITSFTRARILERDKFRCRRCGRGPDDTVSLAVDHIVPVAQGGHGGESNLQTLCSECNTGKGARSPEAHDLRAFANGELPR